MKTQHILLIFPLEYHHLTYVTTCWKHDKREKQVTKCSRNIAWKHYIYIKKIIKTFRANKHRRTKATSKEVVLRADQWLFGNTVLIAQDKIQDVCCCPPGPLPWPLTNADATVKKTNKAALSKALENNVLPPEVSAQPSASMTDAVARIHKVHNENLTFSQLCDKILAMFFTMTREILPRHKMKNWRRLDVHRQLEHGDNISCRYLGKWWP